jgi:transcriptional regulator with XRE-family HTH domain
MTSVQINGERFGSRLRRLREAHKASQHDLAKEVGCTRAAISQYENNQYFPNKETLAKILNVYGATYEWLVNGRGPLPEILESAAKLEVGVEATPAKLRWITGRDVSIIVAPNTIDPILEGDVLFVDMAQRQINGQGWWIIEIKETGRVVTRARLTQTETGDASLQLAIADNWIVPAGAGRTVIGRIIGMFRAIDQSMMTIHSQAKPL